MLREETVIEREKAKRNREQKVTANCPSEKKKKRMTLGSHSSRMPSYITMQQL